MKKKLLAAAAGLIAAPVLGLGVAMTASPARAEPNPEHVIGEDCHGFEVGMRTLDPSGRNIICDTDGYPVQNYHWRLYVGQVPHHCSMGICGND
jgi:hypothetical protein